MARPRRAFQAGVRAEKEVVLAAVIKGEGARTSLASEYTPKAGRPLSAVRHCRRDSTSHFKYVGRGENKRHRSQTGQRISRG